MTRSHIRGLALVAAVVAATACGGATAGSRTTPAPAVQGEAAGIAKARADSMRLPWTTADVHFMSAMIGHHAQAIEMAALAPTHDASPEVRRLAERITNAQRDEIATMQQWLRDRRQPVPEAKSPGTMMTMHHGGAEHAMAMPGMLSEEQMRQLDAARGREFDRLFLTYMIQHHRGATAMVSQLFGSYGAAQDEIVFKFASDVNVDQTTEIARMQRMLLDLALEGGAR